MVLSLLTRGGAYHNKQTNIPKDTHFRQAPLSWPDISSSCPHQVPETESDGEERLLQQGGRGSLLCQEQRLHELLPAEELLLRPLLPQEPVVLPGHGGERHWQDWQGPGQHLQVEDGHSYSCAGGYINIYIFLYYFSSSLFFMNTSG